MASLLISVLLAIGSLSFNPNSEDLNNQENTGNATNSIVVMDVIGA